MIQKLCESSTFSIPMIRAMNGSSHSQTQERIISRGLYKVSSLPPLFFLLQFLHILHQQAPGRVKQLPQHLSKYCTFSKLINAKMRHTSVFFLLMGNAMCLTNLIGRADIVTASPSSTQLPTSHHSDANGHSTLVHPMDSSKLASLESEYSTKVHHNSTHTGTKTHDHHAPDPTEMGEKKHNGTSPERYPKMGERSPSSAATTEPPHSTINDGEYRRSYNTTREHESHSFTGTGTHTHTRSHSHTTSTAAGQSAPMERRQHYNTTQKHESDSLTGTGTHTHPPTHTHSHTKTEGAGKPTATSPVERRHKNKNKDDEDDDKSNPKSSDTDDKSTSKSDAKSDDKTENSNGSGVSLGDKLKLAGAVHSVAVASTKSVTSSAHSNTTMAHATGTGSLAMEQIRKGGIHNGGVQAGGNPFVALCWTVGLAAGLLGFEVLMVLYR